jgi:hypothetical protein
MTQRLTKLASFLLLAGLTAVSAFAQTGGTKVDIPFNFLLVGKRFSAGQYTVLAAEDKVRIQNSHGATVAIVATDSLGGRVPDTNGRVVFNCYAKQCFLSQIWVPRQDSGRCVPASKLEMKLKRQEKEQQFAVLSTEPTT